MKDIFTPSTDQLLAEQWNKMKSGRKTPVKSPKQNGIKEPKVGVVFNKPKDYKIKSQFNEIFDRMVEESCSKCGKDDIPFKKSHKARSSKKKRGIYGESEGVEDIDVSPEEVQTIEDEYGEDKMVSVPKALLDELVSYIEDPMGDEDVTDIDQPEFEELEEGFKYKTAHKKFTETGEWKFLKKALGHYGSKKSGYNRRVKKAHESLAHG